MITLIKDDTEKSNIQNSFFNVFKSYCPFEPVGQLYFPVRVVIFPTDSYHLTFEQFNAMVKAAARFNEKEFIISEVEIPAPFKKGSHWLCTEPSFGDYTKLDTMIENAIYSINGKWGILLSHELHGLLVCDIPFWNIFCKEYPNCKQDMNEFLDYWKSVETEGAKTDWIPLFLKHLSFPECIS
jgi:hypothetical protein